MAQTAIMDAINKIEQMVSIRSFQQWELLKKEFLEKERQQIIDAIDYAATCDAAHGYIPTGEEYFNQTFNQK